MAFQQRPILLDCLVVLKAVGNVPDRHYRELIHGHLDFGPAVELGIVKEEVDSLVPAGGSELLEERNEFVPVDAVVLDDIGQEMMARADRSTDCLAWLVACAVFYHNILARFCPGSLLEAFSSESGLVAENQMTTLLNDAGDLLVQLKCLVFELFKSRRLPRWRLDDPDHLFLEPGLQHHLPQHMG